MWKGFLDLWEWISVLGNFLNMFIRLNSCDYIYREATRINNQKNISVSHSKGLLLNERNELAFFLQELRKILILFESQRAQAARKTQSIIFLYFPFSTRNMMKSIKYLCLREKWSALNITKFSSKNGNWFVREKESNETTSHKFTHIKWRKIVSSAYSITKQPTERKCSKEKVSLAFPQWKIHFSFFLFFSRFSSLDLNALVIRLCTKVEHRAQLNGWSFFKFHWYWLRFTLSFEFITIIVVVDFNISSCRKWRQNRCKNLNVHNSWSWGETSIDSKAKQRKNWDEKFLYLHLIELMLLLNKKISRVSLEHNNRQF